MQHFVGKKKQTAAFSAIIVEVQKFLTNPCFQ